MGKGARPVTRPAARRGWLGGTKSVRANHGKLWDCKAMGANTEAQSRCEQRGWSEARAKAQPPQSGGGFCPRRREAARREQAKRDKTEALSRCGRRGGNGYASPAAFCLANHWKRWDAKPGASGHFAPRSTGCTANQWKHWDAKPEAKGCAGLLAPHWGKRGRNTLRSIGYRTLCVRQNAKRGIKHEKFI